MRPRRASPATPAAPRRRTIEAYGVRLELETGTDPGLLRAVDAVLPPGARVAPLADASSADPPAAALSILRSPDGLHVVRLDGTVLAETPDVDVAVGTLDARMRMTIAMHAASGAFVHAGVVGVGGRAVLLPGRSFAGKTTLVRALIDAGATYLSDEWAVLDEDGLVHPYAKALSVRPPSAFADRAVVTSTDVAPQELGAAIGDRGLPVALIVLARFRPGAAWSPQARTRAQGIVALVANAPQASIAPGRVLAVCRRAVEHAEVVEGERGEAAETAEAILALLEHGPPDPPV